MVPHAGECLALRTGDLLVFDGTMALGLCRRCGAGQVVAAPIDTGVQDRQVLLTGELLLGDARWALLGAPWLTVEHHERRAALELMAAEYDDRSGAIMRLRALRDSTSTNRPTGSGSRRGRPDQDIAA